MEKLDPRLTDTPDDAIRILPEALNEEFVRLPADTYWWGCRYVDACKAYQEADLLYDSTRSQIRLTIRIAAEAGSKKLTAEQVEDMLNGTVEFKKVRVARFESELARDKLKAVCEALRAKRDCLVQLGAQERAEMASSPHINAAEYVNKRVG